eukprot:gene5343-7414_t
MRKIATADHMWSIFISFYMICTTGFSLPIFKFGGSWTSQLISECGTNHTSELIKKFSSKSFNHGNIGLSLPYSRSKVVNNSIIPSMYEIKKISGVIGYGRKVYNRAVDALLSFETVKRLDWVNIIVVPNNKSSSIHHSVEAFINSTIATDARFYDSCLWSLNPCRIVNVQKSKVAPFSFLNYKNNPLIRLLVHNNRPHESYISYSTLQGHLIAGEEIFRVTISPCSGEVTYEVMSYSKGANLLGIMSMFLIRPLQDKFLKNNFQSMKCIISKNNSSA